MPVTCPRCSTVSPDGSAFCPACGSPLGAAPVAGSLATPFGQSAAPPPMVPPPAAAAPLAWTPPPGVGVAQSPQSPYFTAAVPVPPPHRVSPTVTFGVLGGVVAVAIVAGIVLASARGGGNGPTPVALTSPTPAASTPRPTPAPTPRPSAGPTSTPAPPTAQPTAEPTNPPPPPANLFDEKYLSVSVPDGYTVADHTTVSIHLHSADGEVFIDTGFIDPSDPGKTYEGLLNQELTGDQKYSADAKVCDAGQPATLGSQSIPTHTSTICGNWTPTQGTPFGFDDGFVQGIATAQGKPLLIRVDLFGESSKTPVFFKSASVAQILNSVTFKLYGT